jgi:hypothetical protein
MGSGAIVLVVAEISAVAQAIHKNSALSLFTHKQTGPAKMETLSFSFPEAAAPPVVHTALGTYIGQICGLFLCLTGLGPTGRLIESLFVVLETCEF